MELLRINELRTWCDTAEGRLAGQPCSLEAPPALEASSGSRGCTTLLAQYVRDEENPSSQEPPSISLVLFQGLDTDLIKMPLFPDQIDSALQNARVLGGGSSEGGGSWRCWHCLWRGTRGDTLGTAVRGCAESGAGQGGSICQQQGTAGSAPVDATERDSPKPTAVSPWHVSRRSSDKKDAGLARSHRSPVLPEGDKRQPKDGTATASLLGMGPERAMWVSPAMEHPHTARGHPTNRGSLVRAEQTPRYCFFTWDTPGCCPHSSARDFLW